MFDSQDGGWIEVGGSSLSAPLAAAYEAVTGVNGTTPQWAYTDEPLLNGVDGGSNGSCGLALICNAGTGWNGPGGAGSISGDVVHGAPGIGGPDLNDGSATYTENVSSSSAALEGGIYPNSQATSYYWQYGESTSYGFQTATATVPAGTSIVGAAGTLASLMPSSTYHYRLVAANASGTTYGYDFTLTTVAAKLSKPTITFVASSVKHKPAKVEPIKVKRTLKKHKPSRKRKPARKHKPVNKRRTRTTGKRPKRSYR